MSSIDLEALKAQLKSMGHNLPEHEILAILRDMKINHHGTLVAGPG